MLCTAASVIIDQRLAGNYNGVINRELLIFDEADELPAAAALQQDQEVTASALRDANVKLSTAEDTLRKLLKKKRLEPETRAAALMALEAIEEPAWFYQTGINEDGGISLYHRLPGRLLNLDVTDRPQEVSHRHSRGLFMLQLQTSRDVAGQVR